MVGTNRATRRSVRAVRTIPRRPSKIDDRRRATLLDLGPPATRPLKVYASDPSQGTLLGNQMVMQVRYEELEPGPAVRDKFAWDGIAVVDYDAANGVVIPSSRDSDA